MENDEPRYYSDYLNETNIEDVRLSLDADEFRAIVDMTAGGIIAYALGDEHALRIIRALREADNGTS